MAKQMQISNTRTNMNGELVAGESKGASVGMLHQRNEKVLAPPNQHEILTGGEGTQPSEVSTNGAHATFNKGLNLP